MLSTLRIHAIADNTLWCHLQPRLQHALRVLDSFPSEHFYRVNGARVVLINEGVLLRDIFGKHDDNSLAAASDELRDWLLQEAAVLSSPHLCASEVHSAVDFSDQDPLPGTRFPRYGRAYSKIVEVPGELAARQSGKPTHSPASFLWLDSKGTGLQPDRTPKCEEYATGLLPLDEALEEYLWTCILNNVMVHAGTTHRCLPIYGIIDLGFEFRDPAGNNRRSAVLIRRGHVRNVGSDLPIAFTHEHLSCLMIELLIRNYGVTSAAENPPRVLIDGDEISLVSGKGQQGRTRLNASEIDVDPSKIAGAEIDQVNIQFGWSGLSDEIELVDTVHFKTVESFVRPLVSSVADRLGAWGGVILPDSADFVQPDEDISLDKRKCGWSNESDGTRTKKTRLACRRLARRIVDEGLEASEVKSSLDDFAGRATDKLSGKPGLVN